MNYSVSVAMMVVGFLLIGFGIGWLAKPQYKRDSRGMFTK